MAINDNLPWSVLNHNSRTRLYRWRNISPMSSDASSEQVRIDLLLDELAEIIESEQGILIA